MKSYMETLCTTTQGAASKVSQSALNMYAQLQSGLARVETKFCALSVSALALISVNSSTSFPHIHPINLQVRSIELIESDYTPEPVVEFVGFEGELPSVPDYPNPFQNELSCIALNVYHEARGSSIDDQIATAHVVMNRVASARYPDTPCEVVYQSNQFSWTNDSLPNMPTNERAYALAEVVAYQVLFGHTEDITNGATHYHTTDINPYWSRYSVNETVIGAHIYMNLTR
jgi:N-acetylmuramoyl-L-alanine amidase